MKFFPPRPTDTPPESDFSMPGVLKDIATQARLAPEKAFDAAL